MPNQRKKPSPKNASDNQDSFQSVAKRLGADEDKGRFEAKLGKIAKATHVRLPQRSAAVSGKQATGKSAKAKTAKPK